MSAYMADQVLGALRREGGELSVAELADLTKIPSGILMPVLEDLKNQHTITVESSESGLQLVQVSKPRFLNVWGR